jgi:hypothetical protein
MKAVFQAKAFQKQLNNIVEYSIGFLDGAKLGKKALLDNIGKSTIPVLQNYIDIEARSNPQALHHVYEWYQTGSPAARLFNITYTISNVGLSFKSNLTQSDSLAEGARVPFKSKASIMEDGRRVVINPRSGGVLAFENNGEMVYTKKSVTVENPGGEEVQGSYERVFDEFFSVYFTQAFLRSSGLLATLSNPTAYKRNFSAGSRGGRKTGLNAGFKWVANAKIGVE